ncbi:hypothetical protein TcasGA2_TC006617 [Tribolium castaneum]|uniref:Uncharacterized protein n=1 Tax=Tribolium castaneum TaxID=7070 RepID=D6WXV7_TRICA|nr:hypothetical protein TcasGA2_TC006617 [Tribolium castaneum]
MALLHNNLRKNYLNCQNDILASAQRKTVGQSPSLQTQVPQRKSDIWLVFDGGNLQLAVSDDGPAGPPLLVVASSDEKVPCLRKTLARPWFLFFSRNRCLGFRQNIAQLLGVNELLLEWVFRVAEHVFGRNSVMGLLCTRRDTHYFVVMG